MPPWRAQMSRLLGAGMTVECWHILGAQGTGATRSIRAGPRCAGRQQVTHTRQLSGDTVALGTLKHPPEIGCRRHPRLLSKERAQSGANISRPGLPHLGHKRLHCTTQQAICNPQSDVEHHWCNVSRRKHHEG